MVLFESSHLVMSDLPINELDRCLHILKNLGIVSKFYGEIESSYKQYCAKLPEMSDNINFQYPNFAKFKKIMTKFEKLV